MFKKINEAVKAAKAAFNNNTNVQEENTMKANTTTNATNNNSTENKEETKMTLKERMSKAYEKGHKAGYEAVDKIGYGVGFGTRTVTNETKYAAAKVKDAVCGTKVVETFTNGYHNGTADADYAFAQRCAKREEKAREKANEKAAKAAAEELMNEMF